MKAEELARYKRTDGQRKRINRSKGADKNQNALFFQFFIYGSDFVLLVILKCCMLNQRGFHHRLRNLK